MKKFIYIILAALILPIFSFSLVGCDSKEYKLNTFYTTYQNIGNNSRNLRTVTADNLSSGDTSVSYKIDINYSKLNKLSTLLDDNTTQYYYLKHFYQQLLDDSLSPVTFWGENISKSKKVSDKQTKKLFNKLSVLEQEYQDIDYYLESLINSLNATNDSTINLSNLNKLFVEYEQAITAANDLSVVVCDIYFNTIKKVNTYDYSHKTHNQLTQSDLAFISVETRTIVHYFKSIYANAYNQLYLRDGSWADDLSAPNYKTPQSYAPYDYIKNIKSLETISDNGLLNNRSEIYNKSISLYNILNTLKDSYKTFNLATSKVSFTQLNNSSTTDDLAYGAIISQFANGIAVDSYEIINSLVDLLYI